MVGEEHEHGVGNSVPGGHEGPLHQPVSDTGRPSPEQAAVLAGAALGLAGHEVPAYARAMLDRINSGELTYDEAIGEMRAHFTADP